VANSRTAALALLVLTAACGGDSTTTTAAATTSPTAATTTTVATTTTTMDPAACRLPDLSGRLDVYAGYPRGIDRIYPVGAITATVLFVDFDDAPAEMATSEVFELLSPETEMFFSAVSYGRMELVLQPRFEWIRMSRPSTFYGDSILDWESHRDWLREAADLADDYVDFLGSTLLIVIANPAATAIPFGPSFLGYPLDPSGMIENDGAQIANGITSGADLTTFGSRWLGGAVGQVIGFPRLWNFEDGSGFTRPYSVMDDLVGEAPEFLAWERWHAGWLDSEQIVCVTGTDAAATLSAIEVPGGTKAVIVPTGESTAVVVESRRAIGYDGALGSEGVIVYLVDTSKPSGAGPITVVGDALGSGESTVVDGVTVTVVSAGAETDEVTVSVAG
jgi:hypothetical protein